MRLALFLFLFAAFAVVPACLFAGGDRESTPWHLFDQDWTYAWAEPPTAADDTLDWKPIAYPSNPPDRAGRYAVRFRTTLPDLLPSDAALFVPSVDTALTVRVDGSPVYSFGLPSGQFDHSFKGWPWHLIPLPADGAAKQIEFRVYSDYRDIGLWGRLLIGPRNGLLLNLVLRDAPRLLVAASLLTIALLGALIFLFGQARRAYIYMTTLTLLMMLRVASDTYLKQLFLPAPLLWEYLKAATAFAIPGCVALFLVDIVRKPFDLVMKWFGYVYLAVGLGAIALSLTGVYPVYVAYTPSELLFGLFAMVFLVATFASLRRGSRESAILFATFLAMALLNIHDILVARSLLPWTDTTEHYMILFFAAGIATVVAMRVSGMHKEMGRHAAELAALNAGLEETVFSRTHELEEANRQLALEKERLEIASNTDELTRLFNRRYLQATLERELRAAHRYNHPLSVIMLDLDHFKRLNDTYGHVEGDSVLKTIASTIIGELRDVDYAARYGGEEFLVVLPRTDVSGALRVAERIRAAVEGHSWPAGRETTISAGVAAQMPRSSELKINELVSTADEALYRAKAGGRNRVSI